MPNRSGYLDFPRHSIIAQKVTPIGMGRIMIAGDGFYARSPTDTSFDRSVGALGMLGALLHQGDPSSCGCHRGLSESAWKWGESGAMLEKLVGISGSMPEDMHRFSFMRFPNLRL